MGHELEELKRILDNDEEVIDSYKSNKKRFVHLNLLLTGFIFLLFTGGLLTFGILGLTGVITFLNDNGEKEIFPAIMVTVVASIPLLFYLITIIGTIIKYRRAFYVVTNKRIIIRTGIIGVDYKSLYIKNVITCLTLWTYCLNRILHLYRTINLLFVTDWTLQIIYSIFICIWFQIDK